MSPLEHPARPMTDEEYAAGAWSGNFRGWHQYRKDVAGEANPLGHPDSELGCRLAVEPERRRGRFINLLRRCKREAWEGLL